MSLSGAVLQATYQVGELLGSGGMGDVYAASHARLNRQFAIKILHRMFAKNPEAFARFRREALIASSLGHPHIVEVVDFNTLEDGSPYIVMERLEGVDLEDRITGEPMALEVVLHVADQLGSALAAAHAKDVVHRDLKPQNIFVTRVGEDDWYIKILDFGISKIRGSTSIVTQDKTLIGTPYYMAPEQAEGRTDQIDGRTDQFALAVMIYEMLAGKNPFEADTIPSVLYHVVHTEPRPLHEVNPAVPLVASMAVARGMSKSVEDRFPSIRSFVRALRGLPDNVDTGQVRAQRRGRSTTDVDPLAATTFTGADPANAVELPAAPRSRKGPIAAALTAVVMLGVILAIVLIRGGGGDSEREPEGAATPSPPPSADATAAAVEPAAKPAPEPATIKIRFSIKPAPDSIQVDGKPVNGDLVEIVKDGSTHTVRLEKKGYLDESIEVVANANQTVRLRMTKKTARSVRDRKRRERRARRAKRRSSDRAKKRNTTSQEKKKKGKFLLDL